MITISFVSLQIIILYTCFQILKNIKNITTHDYDFYLFIRIDLFLKPDFFKVLNINSEKVEFLAHNFYKGHCGFTDQKDPEVVDLILFVPKKYFYMLDYKFKLNHNAWSYYKKEYKLKNEDMRFMTDLRFDSNSYSLTLHYRFDLYSIFDHYYQIHDQY